MGNLKKVIDEMATRQGWKDKLTLKVSEAAIILGVSLPVMYGITERADFFPLIRIGRKKLILTHRFIVIEWMDMQTEPKANTN